MFLKKPWPASLLIGANAMTISGSTMSRLTLRQPEFQNGSAHLY